MRSAITVVLLLLGGLVTGVLGTLYYVRTLAPPEVVPAPPGTTEPVEVSAREADALSGAAVDGSLEETAPRTGDDTTSDTRTAAPIFPHQDLTLEEIRKGIDGMIDTAGRDRVAYEAYLRELSRRGGRNAVGILLEYMENPDCEFPQRAAVFYSALLDHQDDRIYPAARRVLERNLSTGKDLWSETSGYVALIAEKGGREGGELVVSLTRQDGPVAFVAAGEVWRLNDPALAPPLLNLLETRSGPILFPTADGLLRWGDPGITDALLDLFEARETPAETRQSILRALFQNLPREDIAVLTDRYFSLRSDPDRFLFLEAIGYLERSRKLEAEAIRSAAEPVFESALSAGSLAVRTVALNTLQGKKTYYSARLARVLEEWGRRETSPGMQARINALVQDIRRVLRRS